MSTKDKSKTKPSITTFGTARLIGQFENNSPEWHTLRSAGIGGSDVAAIVGASPWSSPFKIWALKTGALQDASNTTEAMEWGTLLEPVILEKFQREHPEFTVWASPGTWAHQDRPWQLANPDGIYTAPDGSNGIIEIKTARYEDDWAHGVPLYYQTQVNWYCSVFGFTAPAYVAVLFGGSKYREFVVEPDQFAQDTYVAEVEKFLELVRTDTPPEFDGSMATLQTVRELHPDIDPEAEVELGKGLGWDYQNALRQEAEAIEVANQARSRVLDAMGLAKRGLVDGKWTVTRQSRNGGTPFLVQKRG
jgi:putative phage-type endonuclease